MPPINQQGSRGALVTWSVVTAFLFLVCLAFAFYFYIDATDARDQLQTLNRQYSDILPPTALTRADITQVQQLRSQQDSGLTPNMSVVDALIKQRNDLAQLVAGTGAEPTAAQARARQALDSASTALESAGLELSTSDSLAQAIATLTGGLQARVQEIQQLRQDLQAANAQTQQTIQQTQQTIADMQAEVDRIREQQQQQETELADYRQGKDQSVAQIEEARAEERQLAQQAQQEAQNAIRTLQDQVAQLQSDLEAVRTRYEGVRLNTTDPVMRQSDGEVIRVPTQGVVYVNLGQRDSIVPGMTFEVYNREEGLPAMSSLAPDELPKGKASLEITRVGATSSEARVTRSERNTVITEGDVIANLVYDPNTSYKFKVYGNFDLDQNGIPTPQDTELIKQLITQWGGELTENVNVNTDFVVLGAEPELPSFTREELQDPFNARRLADAQASLEQYLQIREQASELRIPILNQNRFLYLIGYYAQAGR